MSGYYRTVQISFLALALTALSLTAGAQVYVVPGGAGAQDGSSWGNAYANLQTALDAAAGSNADVWVAAGTYAISPTINWPSGVAAYGGFPSGGGDWEDRNPWAHETILDRGGSSSTINMATAGTNVIDGFVLTGEVQGYHGVLNVGDRNSTPAVNATIANCVFRDNENREGGIKVEANSNATIENCYFINNDASQMTQGRGGAIHMTHDSSGSVVNSVFIGNQSTDLHAGGSAIFGASRASLTIEYSTFYGNNAPTGSSVVRGPFPISNSIIWGNTPNSVSNGASLTNCMTDVDPLFENAAGNDVSLQPGSPGIDAGLEPWPSTDIRGTARPQGDASDIGAYEAQYEAVTVPDVVGQTEEDAEAALVAMGLTVGSVADDYVFDVPAGQVISQNPEGGATSSMGRPVDLVVSRGNPATVPELVIEDDWQSLEAATSLLEAAGLMVGEIRYAVNESIPFGSVIAQSPAPGSHIPPGSGVDLTLSGGDVMQAFVVKNPYANVNWDAVNQYRANLHCHTVYSDGLAEPDVLINNYANAGYDILAITDHDNYHTTHGSERVTEPTHETTWPWTRWISEEPSEIWVNNGMESSAFYPDLGTRGMLAIRGNELTTEPHILSLFNDLGYEDRYIRAFNREVQTDHDRMSEIQQRGGLAYWAHAGEYAPDGGIYADRVRDPELNWDEVIEHFGNHIINYDSTLGFELQLGAGKPGIHETEFIDRMLNTYYRDHDVFLIGSDDSHSTSVSSNAPLTIVLAEDLTEESVRFALENGHKFAGNRASAYPSFNRITVDEAANVITLDMDNYDTVVWLVNGEEYHEGETLDYSAIDDGIVRFVVNRGSARYLSQAFHIRIDVASETVPELVIDGDWLTQSQVEAALQEAGFILGSVSHGYSSQVPEGHVMGQSPAAGTNLPAGSAVDIVISSGPPPAMPAAGFVTLGALALLGSISGVRHFRRHR